ncbi:MAG: hypothetical protein HDR01_14040 [Lachnospiraceae bacterium]|nr:hypothetical protein [Lachnospiraceae bacterium]
MAALHTYLEKACFFMIGAQLLLYFLPSRKYEKYMGVLTGFICMVILVLPVCNLIFQKQEWQYEERITEFESQLERVLSAEEIRKEKETYESIAGQLEEIYGGKEQLKERLDPIVAQEGFAVKDISYEAEEGKLCIVLEKRQKAEEGIVVEKITWNQNDAEKDQEGLKEKIARELEIDERYIRIQ